MKNWCKRSAGSQFEIFTASDELPQSWDDLLPEGHFLKRTDLKVTESSALPNLEYIYVLATQNGKPLCAVYFQLLRLVPEHINSRLVNNNRSILWTLFTRVAKPKLLVAGHLFRHDICSFYWHPTVSAFEAYQHYRDAIDIVMEGSCASAVLIKDAPNELIIYFTHFAPQYLFLRNDISMELDISSSWQNMQDYERALKHKYAQRMRKIRGTWQGLTVKELSAEDVRENKDKIYNLYRQVTENQQVRMGFLSPEFVVLLHGHYAGQLKIWGIYKQGQMVAFYSAWVKGEVFDMFYIGFDYARNADLQLYFNILFFSIEQAIHFRCKKLVLGRTALDAKARLGCTPKYLSTFLYIRNSIIRKRVLAIQNRNSEKEGAWEERHPFKNG